jgi:hypothetical protein
MTPIEVATRFDAQFDFTDHFEALLVAGPCASTKSGFARFWSVERRHGGRWLTHTIRLIHIDERGTSP